MAKPRRKPRKRAQRKTSTRNRRKPRPVPPMKSTGKPVGRPGMLNHDLIAQIVQHVLRGNFIDTALILSGVHVPTFRLWSRRGLRLIEERARVEALLTEYEARGEETGDDYAATLALLKAVVPPHEQVYVDLVEAIDAAEAASEATDVQRLDALASVDGNLLLKKMSARWKRWRQREEYAHRHEHTGHVQHSHAHAAIIAVEQVAATLPLDVQKQVLAALRASREGAPALIAPPSVESSDGTRDGLDAVHDDPHARDGDRDAVLGAAVPGGLATQHAEMD